MIKLGKLKIEPRAIASQGNAILGIRDSGKTYTATWLAERLQESGIPFVAFDPIGVWRFLRVPGKGAGYPVVVAGGAEGDLPLTVAGAPEIVRAAMANGISLVIDLFDINLSKADWKRIVTACVRVLLHENPKHGLRHVFIEEAAEFAPQRVGPDQGQVYAEMEKLARMGGNSRLGYTLINQRAEEVNKALLELCDNLFLHRQKGRNSLTALSKWLDIGNVAAGREIVSTLPTLPTGECWAWLQGSETPELVKVPAKNSLHPDRRIMRGDEPEIAAKAVNVGKFVATMRTTLTDVEQEAKSLKDAQAENVKLKRELAAALRGASGVPEAVIARRIDTATKERDRVIRELQAQNLRAYKLITAAARDLETSTTVQTNPSGSQVAEPTARDTGPVRDAPTRPEHRSTRPAVAVASAVGITGPEQRILDGIAWMQQIGVMEPNQTAVAFLARYSSADNGAYKNARGALNQRGLVWYLDGGRIKLTEEGAKLANFPGDVSQAELHRRVLAKLPGPECRILQPLLDLWPAAALNDGLAKEANYSDANNGAYKNARGRLRSFGLVEYRDGGVRACDFLFPERQA